MVEPRIKDQQDHPQENQMHLVLPVDLERKPNETLS